MTMCHTGLVSSAQTSCITSGDASTVYDFYSQDTAILRLKIKQMSIDVQTSLEIT